MTFFCYQDTLMFSIGRHLIKFNKKNQTTCVFLSSAMDTVTSRMAISITEEGGIGIVHRNLNIKSQTNEILKVKKKLLVGAAVGTSKEDIVRQNL